MAAAKQETEAVAPGGDPGGNASGDTASEVEVAPGTSTENGAEDPAERRERMAPDEAQDDSADDLNDASGGSGDGPKSPVGGSDGPGDGPESREAAAARLARAVENERLAGVLMALRDQIHALRLPLSAPDVAEARTARTDLLAQMDDYVLPRLRTDIAPMLVVVAGPTGSGKSTLVNSLAGEHVTATGVRRPTTGSPVLVCHPDDRRWFEAGGLLPGLPRVQMAGVHPGAELVVAVAEQMPPGLAVLDSPDIDSVVLEHHELAHKLAGAADQWLFVTSAARYADAPGWQLLGEAGKRSAHVAIALSRVPQGVEGIAEEIEEHLDELLQEIGLEEAERFLVPETRVEDGKLPYDDVQHLRLWLNELAADEDRRDLLIRQSMQGALENVASRVNDLAKQVEAQVTLRADLRLLAAEPYSSALDDVETASSDGSLIKGDVLARWQRFAGKGDLVKALNMKQSRFRRNKGGGPDLDGVDALWSAVRTAVESMVVSAAGRAAEAVAVRWSESFSAPVDFDRMASGVDRRAGETATAWQEHVIELVRTEGVAKRSIAKFVSFDAPALAAVLTINLLGYSLDSVPQRVLRGVFGAESLRSIGAKARNDLHARIGLLFDEEVNRFEDALDSAGVPAAATAVQLRRMAEKVAGQ